MHACMHYRHIAINVTKGQDLQATRQRYIVYALVKTLANDQALQSQYNNYIYSYI